MSIFDVAARMLGSSLKETVLDHIYVEGVEHLQDSSWQDPLVLSDGSLLTLLDFDGSSILRGEDPSIGTPDLEDQVESLRIAITNFFLQPGHAIQIIFSRDPGESGDVLSTSLRRTRHVASGLGLDISDILDERQNHLSSWVVREDITFCLYSRPTVLSPEEGSRGAADLSRRSAEIPPMREAMKAFGSHSTFVTRHMGFVNSVVEALHKIGQRAEVLPPDESVRRIRASVYPSLASTIGDWAPRFHGGRAARAESHRASTRSRAAASNMTQMPHTEKEMAAVDFSSFFPPPLSRQIATSGALVLDNEIARLGDRCVASFDVTLAPEVLDSFNSLVRLMEDGDRSVPWRSSFLIEAGGLQAMSWKRLFVNVFAFASPTRNRRIKAALEELQAIHGASDNVVRLRMSFATWGPADDVNIVRERLNTLRRAVERWGACHTDALAGDPLAGIMSTIPGTPASTAPAAAAPLTEVLALGPFNRPASPWRANGGSLLLRSPDRRLWPYQPGSSQQETWTDILVGTPGSGKSVMMNAINLATVLSPQAAIGEDGYMLLPKIAIEDIGPSSSGLISLLKDALPAHRRHEVVYSRLSMTPNCAINPFDTQLGLRYPLADERSFLVNFLTLICTPEGKTEPNEGIPELIGAVIDEAYEVRDRAPASYARGASREVDARIRELGLKIDDHTSWWEIVDDLAAEGFWHEAALAQRFATPLLQDLMSAVQAEKITDLYGGMTLQETSEPIVKAFQRMISSAIKEIPIISAPTRFDLSTARIISLDLDEVTRGATPRVTSLMFMLARNAMCRDFFLQEDEIRNIRGLPQIYLDLHVRRAQQNKEVPKRLCIDEFHRTGGLAGIRQQVVRDLREGRKHNIQVSLASQLLGDFDKEILDLATSVFICNARSEGARQAAVEAFSVNDAGEFVMKHYLNGPKSAGSPVFAIFKLKTGDIHQHLVSTLGPIELWAFSTTAEDVSLRRILTEKLGAPAARQILARAFPGGSAKPEIEKRLARIEELGDDAGDQARDGVVVELARELIERFATADDKRKAKR